VSGNVRKICRDVKNNLIDDKNKKKMLGRWWAMSRK
jgi:hypothetical protein